jgi:hypothetical protein
MWYLNVIKNKIMECEIIEDLEIKPLIKIKEIESNKIKFLIVGSESLNIINKKYSELIGKRIFFLRYERNLAALYKECNIYINPPRNGGGYSVGEAMFNGLPIVLFNESRDAAIWAGEENCSDDYIEYNEEIERLYIDESYFKKKSEKMKIRIEDSSFQKHLEEIFAYIWKNKILF